MRPWHRAPATSCPTLAGNRMPRYGGGADMPTLRPIVLVGSVKKTDRSGSHRSRTRAVAMPKRYLAVTQMELTLRFSEDGAPVRHVLRALLLDPSKGWQAQQLDLRYPGLNDG